MQHRLIRAFDVPPQSWRNGGGVTRELMAWPSGTADWRLRISVAEIASDGPFSAFPGVERWMAVLAGNGVELTVGGGMHRLRGGDTPLRFPGGSPAVCRLIDGPVQDLNLMLRGIQGGMHAAMGGETWTPPSGFAAGLFCSEPARCAGIDVPRDALLWFPAAPAVLPLTANRGTAGPVGWWLAAAIDGASS